MVWIWVRRSLRYYRLRHLAFAGTVALTSAILSGALLTGESLRQGLQSGLRARLGKVRSAVYLSEGLFPASLAGRLPDAQAALLLRGELLTADGAVCADRAQIIGVGLTNSAAGGLFPAALNARGREVLADAEAAVRFEKPALFSAEMPLGAAKAARMVRRAVQTGTAAAENLILPDFALQAASVPPVNVFLPYAALAGAADAPGMANLLVSAKPPKALLQALGEVLTAEDKGFVLETARGETLVKSRRVYLPDQSLCRALERDGALGAATFHLADSFECVTSSGATNRTPYGFVAAMTPDGGCVPDGLGKDEAAVNAWLAAALCLQAGDSLTMRWRRFAADGRLVPEARVFRVARVIPMEAAAAAKRRMPAFPGLEGVDSCAAWDVGLPLDEEQLKDAANEAYWKQWRETPKVFLNFGEHSRAFGGASGLMSVWSAAGENAVRKRLAAVSPAEVGFHVRDVWADGLAAAQGSTDFRMLFAGMAFVLVVSALLLSALSLALALETRQGEVALFSALGLSRTMAVRLLAAEWCVPLAAGAAAGAGLGSLLARALVWSLGRFWSDAFAGAGMSFRFSWPAAGTAAGLSAALTFFVLVRAVSRFTQAHPADLWRGAGRESQDTLKCGSSKGGAVGMSVAGGVSAAGACAVMVLSPVGAAANGAFFGAGFLLMVSLLLFVWTLGVAWRWRGHGPSGGGTACGIPLAHSAVRAGVCRALQTPRRSAPVVILLAVGTFLSVGILSMKHDPAAGCERPSSGSGGFASVVTSVVPFDRERGLEMARRVSGAKGVVPVRVHAEDEAGCLNMNRPVRPQVIGLDARALARARAFEPEDSGGVWTLLESELESGAIPALAADQTMLRYSLKAKAGSADGTEYVYPGLDGAGARVRVVGALPVRSGILQGALIVDEARFVRLFPRETGYRMWLCDYAPYLLRERADGSRGRSPSKEALKAGAGETLSSRAGTVSKLRHPEPGVAVTTVEERLRLLGSVESTYLDMFLVLAGLGVVLGVAGIALVMLRGVEERRGELALLSAVGVPRREVVRLMTAEYGVLALAGLVAGTVPALVAIQPAARSLGDRLPWGAMAGIVAAMLLCAALCVVLAALKASRRFGPEMLKEEV